VSNDIEVITAHEQPAALGRAAAADAKGVRHQALIQLYRARRLADD
jgi:hypothetical protein